MKENWRKILGHPKYEISNLGNFACGGRLKVPTFNKSGYYYVELYSRERRIRHRRGRLVAKLFVPNPDNFPCVNHKNLNKTDDRASNLEWCTQSQNLLHAIKNGARNYIGMNVGTKNPAACLTSRDVRRVIELKGEVSSRIVSKSFGVSKTQILRIWSKQSWKHLS